MKIDVEGSKQGKEFQDMIHIYQGQIHDHNIVRYQLLAVTGSNLLQIWSASCKVRIIDDSVAAQQTE